MLPIQKQEGPLLIIIHPHHAGEVCGRVGGWMFWTKECVLGSQARSLILAWLFRGGLCYIEVAIFLH